MFNGIDNVTFDNVNGDDIPGVAFIVGGKRWLVYFDRGHINLFIDGEGGVWSK